MIELERREAAVAEREAKRQALLVEVGAAPAAKSTKPKKKASATA
jgi:hypothetical protein